MDKLNEISNYKEIKEILNCKINVNIYYDFIDNKLVNANYDIKECNIYLVLKENKNRLKINFFAYDFYGIEDIKIKFKETTYHSVLINGNEEEKKYKKIGNTNYIKRIKKTYNQEFDSILNTLKNYAETYKDHILRKYINLYKHQEHFLHLLYICGIEDFYAFFKYCKRENWQTDIDLIEGYKKECSKYNLPVSLRPYGFRETIKSEKFSTTSNSKETK